MKGWRILALMAGAAMVMVVCKPAYSDSATMADCLRVPLMIFAPFAVLYLACLLGYYVDRRRTQREKKEASK